MENQQLKIALAMDPCRGVKPIVSAKSAMVKAVIPKPNWEKKPQARNKQNSGRLKKLTSNPR